MKDKRDLTNEEQYWYNHSKGYRQGQIGATREILINALNRKGDEQNSKPSKALIRKINRETDLGYLSKIMYDLIGDRITLAEVENRYDMIFRSDDEIQNEKYAITSNKRTKKTRLLP